MVSYCCVQGCRSNGSEKKKHTKSGITFHAFPTNSKLRSQWLSAIGRPSWDPPQYARVCSQHFHETQINRLNQRTRLMESAYPVMELPNSFLYDASKEEICRVCLATDLKMYSLQNKELQTCFKSIVEFDKEIDGLPETVCFECAAQVLKCHKFIEKSIIARDTLLDILNKNGHISKQLVNKVNRTQLNLQSSLTHNTIVPKTLIDLHYDEDLHSYIYTCKTLENDTNYQNNSEENKFKYQNETQKMELNFSDVLDGLKIEESKEPMNNDMYEIKDDISSHSDASVDANFVICDPDDGLDDLPLAKLEKIKSDEKKKTKKPKKQLISKNAEGLTPEEVDMQKYFTVAVLSPEEQIEERTKMKESTAYRDALYKCEICYKTYLHPNAYNTHLECHKSDRGPAECPVCKIRYKSEVQATSHAQRAHGKKFYCKTCTKVFYNVRVAKKHQRQHGDSDYKCSHCEFTACDKDELTSHNNSTHASRNVCAQCGQTFTSERGLTLHTARIHRVAKDVTETGLFHCKQCDIHFPSENTWKVHVSTSSQHRKSMLGESVNSTHKCFRCDEQFASVRELHAHVRAQHALSKKAWSMPGDCYPTNCEHCGLSVNNRKEHYFHVRREHPKLREQYRPVIHAVCDTCGKGFQNSTKLHLHELRHKGVGTVRCPHCPRLFYDKYQLSRHIGVHSDARPFACRLCDKTFKLRSNLDRHAKVHSGTTSYECTMCNKRFRYSSSRNLHVRTVHYKMPQPPRKKRPNKNVRNPNYENCV